MSTHANADALLAWFRNRESATVGDITAAGLMNSRAASDAVQYAVRSGALERVVRAGASAKERMRYRSTGVPLPARRQSGVPASFDRLLEAWGIVREPVALLATDVHRYQIADHD